MLKTKAIKIGDIDINMIQFGAIEALNLRKELVENIKKQVGTSEMDASSIVKAVTGLIYEIPVELLLKLFKNCSAIDVGGLDNKNNFEKVFNDNLDGSIELALEVLDFNGFFTLNILSILTKKIPMLAPMEKAIKEALEKAKQS